MNCTHKKVDVFSRMISSATREEPAEYSEWGVCTDCGYKLDVSDIPDDTEIAEGTYETQPRGMPSEFYD